MDPANDDEFGKVLDQLPNQEMAQKIKQMGMAAYFEVFKAEQAAKEARYQRERMERVKERCAGCKLEAKTYDATISLVRAPCTSCTRNPYYEDRYEKP